MMPVLASRIGCDRRSADISARANSARNGGSGKTAISGSGWNLLLSPTVAAADQKHKAGGVISPARVCRMHTEYIQGRPAESGAALHLHDVDAIVIEFAALETKRVEHADRDRKILQFAKGIWLH